MSVIPLILDGEFCTVVEMQSAFSLDGDAILIQGLDRDQLSAENDANISYDLRVGREYRDHRDIGKRELPEKCSIKLLPGAAVIHRD